MQGKRRMLQGDEMGDIKKGPWKVEEDQVLINHVNKYGPRNWSSIRSKGLLRRTGKSCRLRWVNKLRPDLKTGVKFSAEEERSVIDLQAEFGNKWAKIATYLPGRTDNDVKNFWSSRQKRLARLARILHTSAPSSSKSNKTTKQIQNPNFPPLKEPPNLSLSIEDAFAAKSQQLCSSLVYPSARISFPIEEYPLLSFVEDEFEHSSAQLPIFPTQGSSSHDIKDFGSLIDDFPPMDLFEQLPSPSDWS